MSLSFHIAPAPGLALAAAIRPPTPASRAPARRRPHALLELRASAPAPLRRAGVWLGSAWPIATLAILRRRDRGARAGGAALTRGALAVSR
jgi:hypothetical protein